MDYLLSRMRAVAVIMLGLMLCLPLPIWAVQTDYAALEKRVAAVESTLTDWETIVGRYRAIEAELALHLSAARRKEARALTNYADFKTTLRSLSLLTWKPNVEDTESALNRVRKRTTELESALATWNQQVRQARQCQDEICANKARLGSCPPPPPEQIASWSDSGSRLLEDATAAVRENRKALSAAWDALSSVSGELDIELGRLEALLTRQDEVQTAYSRLTALGATCKAACKEAEQDLAKARELQNELIALMKKAIAIDGADLLKYLERLQQEAATGANVPSDSDRENLKARIDSALRKLELTTLPLTLPEVGELDPRCKKFISQTVQLDPTVMKANFQRIESVVASARPALSRARTALKQASSAQAVFGGLGEARNCLASLRQAQVHAGKTDVDSVISLVEGLQTRLEKAERQEHLFIIRNRENRARSKKMKRKVEDARNIYQTWQHVHEELAKRLGRLEPDQAMQNVEKLLSGLAQQVDEMKKTARTMTKTAREIEQQQKAICERATKAGSVPPPSSAELQDWHQKSRSELNRVRQPMEAAFRTAQVHAGFVASQAQEVAVSRDKLSAIKDNLIIWIRGTADCHVQMTRAQDLLKQASKIWKQVKSEGKALESQRKIHLEELRKIHDAAATLIPRLVDRSTIAELKAIEATAAALADRYPQVSVTDGLILRDELSVILSVNRDEPLLQKLSDSLAASEQQVSQIVRLIKKAKSTLEQADSVREAAGRDRSSATAALAEADKCVSALAKAVSTAGEAVTKARQALQECNYDRVQVLLSEIAPGPDKDALVREVKACRKLESELRFMVDEARALYRECRFNKVDPILDRALAKAKCPDHKKSIKGKIELSDKRRKYEEPTIALFKEAKALYHDCRYQDVLDKLHQARKRTSCQRFRDSLDKKIATAEKAAKLHDEAKALFEKAKGLYKVGKYDETIAILKMAIKKTPCSDYKDFLRKKIAKVEGKIDSSPDEQVARKDCSAHGGPEAVKAYWDADEQKAKCKCKSGYKPSGNTCVPTREILVQNLDCRAYPNTYAAWDHKNNRAACFCINKNYKWRSDGKGCIPKSGPVPANPMCPAAVYAIKNKLRSGDNTGLTLLANNAKSMGCTDPVIDQVLSGGTGGGGTGGGTGGGGGTGQGERCVIHSMNCGGNNHFLLKSAKSGAPTAYIVMTVANPTKQDCKFGRICTARQVVKKAVPGASIIGQYVSRSQAQKAAKRYCPNPIY